MSTRSHFSIATVLYEAARPYLKEFFTALNIASIGKSVSLVAVIDGLVDPQEALAPLHKDISVCLAEIPSGVSFTGVRRLLLEKVLKTRDGFLIFTDCDDMLEPTALDRHAEALGQADFSFSDQILIDESGKKLGRTLFQNWSVPQRVKELSDLIDGNFVGFSGAALRAESLTGTLCRIPDQVIAVDWWFFSNLLLSGSQGIQTKEPVVRYRQHPGNTVGAEPTPTLEACLRRCAVILAHYASLPDLPLVRERRKGVEQLMKEIESQQDKMTPMIEKACADSTCWYADIRRLVQMLGNKCSNTSENVKTK